MFYTGYFVIIIIIIIIKPPKTIIFLSGQCYKTQSSYFLSNLSSNVNVFECINSNTLLLCLFQKVLMIINKFPKDENGHNLDR